MISDVKWAEGLTMRYVEIHGWSICESKLDAGTEVANPDGVLVEHFAEVQDAIDYVQERLRTVQP